MVLEIHVNELIKNRWRRRLMTMFSPRAGFCATPLWQGVFELQGMARTPFVAFKLPNLLRRILPGRGVFFRHLCLFSRNIKASGRRDATAFFVSLCLWAADLALAVVTVIPGCWLRCGDSGDWAAWFCRYGR